MKKREWVTGSYTVEAALIMPIILFIILAIIYMTFYMHDRVKINQIIDRAIRKENTLVKHIADYETGELDYERINERGIFYFLLGSFDKEREILIQNLEEELKQGLFLIKVQQIQANITQQKIEIVIKYIKNISLIQVRGYFSTIDKQQKIETNYLVHNPEEFVRGYEALDSTISELEGYTKIKEKLQKLLEVFNLIKEVPLFKRKER